MRKICLLVVLASSIVAPAADRTPAPLSPDDAVKAMVLPEGFKATLVACEPDIVQPVAYCFDDRGRLFVAEAYNYGFWQPHGKDRIVILEDTDGDGRFETRKVFYDGLNYVTGIEVGFGGVYVMSPPNLLFIPDRDGDDKPDSKPEVLFDGFGHKESRHNMANGFTWGPDGWLYGGHGRTTPSDVGRPGTPANQRIHCDGGVYRIHPTRLVFETFADGTTNPWGVDFDDFGQCFVSNCVNPHLFHMIQGGHYEPWRNRVSSMYAYDRLPTCADHLHYPTGKPNAMRGETPETLALGGGHAHCGTLIYKGDSFPKQYRNSVFMCNVHGRRINNDILKRKGSSYTASHGADFMLAGDPWFMGVTLRTGPDGSIFVSDWSDTGECHTYKPDRSSGRIFKLSYGQPKHAPIDLAKLSDAELVKLQMHANDWHVVRARRLLQERAAKPNWDGKTVHASLRDMLANELDASRRLRAFWTLRVTNGIDTSGLIALLGDSNEHVRSWAIQLLCENQKPPASAVEKFATLAKSDPSPVVRLYLAAALQQLPLAERWNIAEGLVGHAEDTDDANLPLMYWYGIEPLMTEHGSNTVKLAAAARIPLLRQYMGRRLVDDAIARGDKGDLDDFTTILGDANDPSRVDFLMGAREGLRGRKSMKMPKGWAEVQARLKESTNATVREQAMLLALVFGDPQALADLRKTLLTTTRPVAERQAALVALLDKRQADLAPVLHDLLSDKELRRTALRGLASIPHEATPRLILDRYSQFTADDKQEAIATLSSRKDFALALLDALEKKKIAQLDITAFVARQLHTLGDKEVTERLRKSWGEVRDTQPEKQEQIARYKKMLTPTFLKNADLANGRLLYSKSCMACHQLHGEGGKIGPDLSGTNRTNLDYLLSNIVDPSAEIGRDFRMSAVHTASGRVVTGIIAERTPARITIQTATERLVISPEEVDEIRDSKVSMMPEGQLEQLTKEQIRDLFAYLAQQKQVPLPR